MPFTRRNFLSRSVSAGVAASVGFDFINPISCFGQTVDRQPGKLGGELGFSLYGMKSLELNAALKTCAEIGFRGVEIPLMADWPCDSAKMTAEKCRELRSSLQGANLKLFALMENLVLLGSDAHQEKQRDRLKQAMEVAHRIHPDSPPLVETVFGGKPGDWPTVKPAMVAALNEWAKIAESAKTVLAIKAHAMAAVQRPAELVELLQAVESPWVRAAFDYSHFQRLDLSLKESLDTLLPRTVFIHLKDNVRAADGKFAFALPGDGNPAIDSAEYAHRLRTANYQGPVVVEVSAQVFNQPGYDPITAAKRSFAALKSHWE